MSSTGSPTAESAQATEAIDPFGRYDEPVTITIGKEVPPDDKSLPTGDTVENNQYTRYFEEKLNLKFKAAWIATSGDAFDQKLKLSISSNDIPDAMVVGEKELRLLVKAGQVEDLTEAYQNYVSPTLKSMYDATEGRSLEAATFDGKLMALPNVNVEADAIQLLWIRQDWLDKLGLQPPKTIEDLKNVAKAFIEKDPDGNKKADTLGLVGTNFEPIYASYHAYPRLWMKDESGKVTYGSINSETKQALSKLREMYEEGLIDKEFAIRKDMNELLVSGKAGMYFSPWWAPWYPLADTVKTNPNAQWKAYAVPLDSNGVFNTRLNPASSSFFVLKKGYKHPEALVKYMNVYSSIETDPEALAKLDSKVNAFYYPLRATMVAPNVVTVRYNAVKQALAGELKADELTVDQKDIYEKVLREQANPHADMGDWSFTNAYLVGAAALEVNMNKVYGAFYSQTKAMELKWPALDKLENEYFIKIIMGTEPIDSFDKYVEEWKRTGGDEITAEVEEATKK